MTFAGFVLAGGRSSRMGRDKALLPYRSKTLVDHVASQVLRVTGSVTLIGPPDAYRHLGYPIVADCIPDCGPLSGIYTALSLQHADWNLVVGCDLPAICSSQLQLILEAADETSDCVVPILADGSSQPLCAAYHRRCHAKIEQAVLQKRLRVRDLLRELSTITLPVSASELFANVNSPADWERLG